MHLPVKTLLLGALLLGFAPAHADDTLRKAQQALRDQGFYYGSVDGSPGDETTQAIRRYQIRNGLAVTGQLNDETQKSIARTGSASARPAAPQPTVPPPLERPAPSTIRGNPEDVAPAPPPRRVVPPPAPAPRPDLRAPPEDDAEDDAQEPPPPPSRGGIRPSATLTNLFSDTPFEFAPPPVQSDVLRRAQITLLRSGFFGGEPDGIPGRATIDALAEFQSANQLRRTGRMDVHTLAALRLLPGRRAGRPVYEGRIVR